MKTSFLIFHVSFLLVCIAIPLNALQNSPDSSVVIKRIQLIEQNDSIDLLKQTYKRKGIALTELEEKQNSIHDTLKILNNRIQDFNPSTNQNSILDFIKSIPLKPDTIFDWIIIIVGIIAVISGIFLIFGIISMATSKTRAHQKKKTLPRNLSAPHKMQAPQTQPIDELRALATNTSETVIQLRRQIKNIEHENNTPALEQVNQHMGSEEEMAPLQTSDDSYRHDAQLEKRIIEAARSGANKQEISKKFHISVDQIALILKVAGVKTPKSTGR